MEHTLSFIPEDRVIVYNNVTYVSESFTPISEEHRKIWALHWTPRYKHIEFTDGTYKEISSEEDYQQYVFPYVLKVNEYINSQATKVLETNTEEYCAAQVRAYRNRYLKDTDFAVLSDTPLSTEELEDIKKYRQELRDITEKEGFPWTGTPVENIPWPKNPLEQGA